MEEIDSEGVLTPAVTTADENFERMRSDSERHQALKLFEKLIIKQQKGSKVRIDKNQWIKLEFDVRPRSNPRVLVSGKQSVRANYDSMYQTSGRKPERTYKKKVFVKYNPLFNKEFCLSA